MKTERAQTTIGNDLDSITDRVKEGIRSGRYTLSEFQSAMMDRTREAAKNTDLYVHENAWKVVGMAAGLGLVIGLLIRRR